MTETDQYASTYFIDQQESNAEYWRRFKQQPNFANKRVLEIGCGHGAMSVRLAQLGAHVVGVDLDQGRINFARRNLHANFPELKEQILFAAEDISALTVDEPFDIVVSKDTFEHVEDVPALLRHIHSLLSPKGLAYIGFSPLYYSPYGDHGRTGLKAPWAHALLPTKAVLKSASRHNSDSRTVTSLLDIGLNGNTPSDFRKAFDDSGLTPISIEYNCGDKRLLRVLDAIRLRIPSLEKYSTVSIYAVLQR